MDQTRWAIVALVSVIVFGLLTAGAYLLYRRIKKKLPPPPSSPPSSPVVVSDKGQRVVTVERVPVPPVPVPAPKPPAIPASPLPTPLAPIIPIPAPVPIPTPLPDIPDIPVPSPASTALDLKYPHWGWGAHNGLKCKNGDNTECTTAWKDGNLIDVEPSVQRPPPPAPRPPPPAPRPPPPAPRPPAPRPPAPRPPPPAPRPPPPAPRPPPPPVPSTKMGAHTGALLASMPVSDLTLSKGGAWNLKKGVNWRKSKLTTFEGEQVIQVNHDRNSGTSQHKGIGGISITTVPRGFPRSQGGAVVSFDVYFPAGWKWAKGGKFGGVGIGTEPASGGRHNDRGASNRVMWQFDGGAILYIYPPSGVKQVAPALARAKKYGNGVFNKEFAGALKVGQWNTIELGTKLNTFSGSKPNADGAGSLTVNGRTETIERVIWRRFPDLRLEAFDLGVFFGGPDPSPVDQHAYYKNFRVYEWKD